MRILLLVDAFRSLGGIEEIVDYLSLEFIRLGHQVTIASTPDFAPGCERQPRTTAECLYLDIPSRKPVSLRHLERMVRQPRALELARCLAACRPEIINSHVWQWDRLPTIVEACRSAGAPLVQSFDTDEWGRGKLGRSALSQLKHAAALTALSEAVKQNLGRLIGRPAEVITGGVDCLAADAAPAYRHSRPYIFSAARLDLRHKAIDILIDAFAEIAPEFATLDLLIAGNGPDREALTARARAAGLAARVTLLGALPHERLWSLYKGAELFALPSRGGEAMGLVFLEAMACGKPVVATRSGGVPEIVRDGGVLTTPDPAAFAAALRRLLADPDAAAQMGRVAKQRTDDSYSWAAVARKYLRVYASCVT